MSFKIKVEISGADKRAAALQAFPGELLAVASGAVNRVAKPLYPRCQREIVSQVNLTEGYVRDRMSLTLATPEQPVAIISARRRATRLATYAAQQVTVAAPDAKGDPLRGIPRGMKQAGVSVSVKRGGARKTMSHAFLIPLLNGNGLGVFVRTGTGRKDIRHLYGPSVDQVLSRVIDDIYPEIQQSLASEVGAGLDEAIARKL